MSLSSSTAIYAVDVPGDESDYEEETISSEASQEYMPSVAPLQPDHYWENVVFQVENAFFKVPTYHFVTQSEVFADMLSLPQGQVAATEGQSRENPIVLPITEQDFRRLLRALYPLEAPRSPTFSKEELVSLLKLSKLWAMKRVREYAVEKITEILYSIDATERIILAREYSVETWLRSGYLTLATRYPVVSIEDAKLIGWETALLLEHVREEAYASLGGSRMGRGSLSENQVQSGVENKFREEFRDIRMSEAAYRV
ncbi:uncharacterized protein EV420DRAFT_1642185 [Desarmillaria tabescens]|uniref:BTB domain-containing protein n=1 Tax=Armillaria tabescens TaxID=1929756 RepID=A0AA39KDJ6_ARMTA|nr:uncharacterized protein EV420DRAFT_1642185 [Desarmillaria tabescens]KAK0459201.1 hypothetical protein EV420DRAFT_1642185 [Desarmillaria tabescens]